MWHRSSLASSDQNAPSLVVVPVVASVVVPDDPRVGDPRVGSSNAAIDASVVDTDQPDRVYAVVTSVPQTQSRVQGIESISVLADLSPDKTA